MSCLTMHTARKARPCGSYPCDRDINVGELYIRHVAFPGDDGHEDGTRPWVIAECIACADGDLAYIRDQYDVPATVGLRITADGKAGVITGAMGASLRVLLDGQKHATPWHPTWRIDYGVPAAPRPAPAPRAVTVELAGVS